MGYPDRWLFYYVKEVVLFFYRSPERLPSKLSAFRPLTGPRAPRGLELAPTNNNNSVCRVKIRTNLLLLLPRPLEGLVWDPD